MKCAGRIVRVAAAFAPAEFFFAVFALPGAEDAGLKAEKSVWQRGFRRRRGGRKLRI